MTSFTCHFDISKIQYDPQKIEPQFAHVYCMNSGSLLYLTEHRGVWSKTAGSVEDVMLALVVELMETLHGPTQPPPLEKPGMGRPKDR